MGLVIHIGQPKAASTSIQKALLRQQSLLASAGIAYPVRTSHQHGAQVCDFLAQFDVKVTRENRRLLGGWDLLQSDVKAAEQAIVSAELLTAATPEAARIFVEALARPAQKVDVVLVIRRASQAVTSTYGLRVLRQPVPSFEVWARSALALALRNPEHFVTLNNPHLRRIWTPHAQMREVFLDTSQSAGFEDHVLEAFGISDVVDRPFLGRDNVSPPAALLVAWQRCRDDARGRDDSVLKALLAERRSELSALPGKGGAFRLSSETADLVDAAFPAQDEAFAQAVDARELLLRRLGGSEPITEMGTDDHCFEAAVEQCEWLLRDSAAQSRS